MDWLLVVGFVVVLGIGFGAGWAGRWFLDRRSEARALNNLVMYLHMKQSLAPIEPRPVPPGLEVKRARSSVADIREKVIETLACVHDSTGVNDVLMRMSAACTGYLRTALRDPEQYQFELMELRRNLVEDLRIISDGRRDVRYLAPGGHGAERRTAVRSAGGRTAGKWGGDRKRRAGRTGSKNGTGPGTTSGPASKTTPRARSHRAVPARAFSRSLSPK